ncbi:MAG: electron transfer flavoprotein subunit alpha/FixB family protein [Pseudomonadota bacterium]|nr:electron transfer flavoprotein subunit alpha/FixB family protein [Pseudomonadota bacterium]
MSGTLIIAEHRQGELCQATLETITSAIKSHTPDIRVVVIGKQIEPFIEAVRIEGILEVIAIRTSSNDFDPDLYAVTLTMLINSYHPELILLPHTVNTIGYAAAVAADQRLGFATDVFDFSISNGIVTAIRSGYGQKVNVELGFPENRPVCLTLRPNIWKPLQANKAGIVIEIHPPVYSARCRHETYLEPKSSGDIDIPGAAFILSIGRGVADEKNVEEFLELADSLGATLGCSRPIADNGWLPKARQVGQSGKTASNCKLYIAMGISGSVQHLAGMKHVENIVAINTDREASIFNYARYGIVADMFEIAEELRNQFPE